MKIGALSFLASPADVRGGNVHMVKVYWGPIPQGHNLITFFLKMRRYGQLMSENETFPQILFRKKEVPRYFSHLDLYGRSPPEIPHSQNSI